MKNIGFVKTDILVPNKNQDFKKWSVIACDQYTSEPEYWEQVKEFVKDAPSSLHIVFPEAYLKSDDAEKKIADINATMDKYLSDGIFDEYKNSLVYLERTLRDGSVRHGIIGAVDLEDYDYNKYSETLIRTTEGTILDRLPPRVKVRENASLELPHILLLIDDKENNVFSSVQVEESDKLYDFELMQDSGALKGYHIPDASADKILSELEKLADKQAFEEKYGVKDKPVILFAVGDGNHSLATAKQCYEKLKEKIGDEAKKSPARYAMVEVVNLHDEALTVEPIHCVVFDTDVDDMIADFYSKYDISETPCDGHKITIVVGEKTKNLYVKHPDYNVPAATLQEFLEMYLAEHKGTIDFIHGDDVVKSLAKESKNNIGFILPDLDKNELFKTVILDGAYPRKTVSMGNSYDKRFYLECRKIK